MEDVFYVKYKVQPQLVADTHQYMYKSAGELFSVKRVNHDNWSQGFTALCNQDCNTVSAGSGYTP